MRKAILVIIACACLLGGPIRKAVADTTGPQAEQATPQQTATTTAPSQVKTATRVAPLFFHGSGKALLALEETDSPVFLSDAEACEVIAEEARTADIAFSVVNRLLAIPGSRDGIRATQGRSLTLDGTDASRKISFAFISVADANAARRKLIPGSSIEEIEIRDYADSLRQRVAEAGPEGTFAIFYDPVITLSEVIPHLTESEAATVDLADQARQMARKELRRQVRDFLDWLKAKNAA